MKSHNVLAILLILAGASLSATSFLGLGPAPESSTYEGILLSVGGALIVVGVSLLSFGSKTKDSKQKKEHYRS